MSTPPNLPWWHPAAVARRRPFLAARQRIAGAVRGTFAERDVVEVETPALQVSPGLEPHLHPFATALAEPFDDGRPVPLHLHTSPELAMKKLLVGGVPRLFQLARVFRNGERGPLHHPEFTMLEWYRAGEGVAALMDDCEALVRAALLAAGRDRLAWQGVGCDAAAPFGRLSVAEAFARMAGIDVLASLGEPQALAAEARRIGVTIGAADEWEDIYFRIFLDRVEPNLGRDRPCFLTGFPAPLAALARLDAADPRVSTRFELYAAGVELANGWVELTDVAEHRRRLEAAQDKRRRLYGAALPIDHDFMAAIAAGLPDCAGIAMGFDRLVMLATGADTIEDVLWAPVASGGPAPP